MGPLEALSVGCATLGAVWRGGTPICVQVFGFRDFHDHEYYGIGLEVSDRGRDRHITTRV